MERELVEEVLLPLTLGKTLTVRSPLDADDVDELTRTRESQVGIADFAEARRRVIARYLYDAHAPMLDQDAIRLGAAVHNLCWLMASPKREESRGVMGRVASYTERVAKLPPPADEEALCARHAIVGALPTLQRHDVRVRFWAGEQTFLGESPPARLLRWQKVRRVREDHTTVRLFDEALESAHGRVIIAALLGSSPLTDLLLLENRRTPIDLKRGARWLATPRIARSIADIYLARGLANVEAPLVLALTTLYAQEGAQREAKIATAFHSHLHLLDVLTRPPRDREGHLQVLRGYLQGRDRTVSDGFGLHAVAERHGLGRPHDLASDPLLERNITAYGEACAELVGARRIAELTTLLVSGIGAEGLPAHVMMGRP